MCGVATAAPERNPDLVTRRVSISETALRPGDSLRAGVTVRNLGRAPARRSRRASVLGAAGQADRSKQVLSQAMSRRVLGHPDGQGAALVHLGLHHE